MALKFNRGFQHPIQAISFDLDDTLYYNETVIQNAEQAQFDKICELVPEAHTQGIEFWKTLKWAVLEAEPEMYHDVTVWRMQVIRQGLGELGLENAKLESMAKSVFEAFYEARSDFTVPELSFRVLKQLQSRFPLVAVTNGNADIERIGLAPYFVGYYRAGLYGTKSKPYPDMLNLAAKQLDINPKHILHIGDSIDSDIKAALNSGCQSLWFNPDLTPHYPGQILPDGEFSHLDDLLHLL